MRISKIMCHFKHDRAKVPRCTCTNIRLGSRNELPLARASKFEIVTRQCEGDRNRSNDRSAARNRCRALDTRRRREREENDEEGARALAGAISTSAAMASGLERKMRVQAFFNALIESDWSNSRAAETARRMSKSSWGYCCGYRCRRARVSAYRYSNFWEQSWLFSRLNPVSKVDGFNWSLLMDMDTVVWSLAHARWTRYCGGLYNYMFKYQPFCCCVNFWGTLECIDGLIHRVALLNYLYVISSKQYQSLSI